MSKSRWSKTNAAGAMIGLTKYSKQFSTQAVSAESIKPNRQYRRASKKA